MFYCRTLKHLQKSLQEAKKKPNKKKEWFWDDLTEGYSIGMWARYSVYMVY